MKNYRADWIALVLVIAMLAGLPAALYAYEQTIVMGQYPEDARVITLTGLAKEGCWTTKDVVGHNYWRESFAKNPVELQQNEKVILRLKSADVYHSFSIPALRIRPVEIEPGHVVDIELQIDEVDSYLFNCYTVCGKGHEYMTGILQVMPEEIPQLIAQTEEPS